MVKTKPVILLFLLLVLVGTILSLPHINFTVEDGTVIRHRYNADTQTYDMESNVTSTTVSISASSHDGVVRYGDATYPVDGGTPFVDDNDSELNVGQYILASTYYVARNYLRFDTSSILAGENITAVTLQLYVDDDYSDTDFLVCVRNWTGDIPILVADWTAYGTTTYGTFNTSGMVTGSYNNITFTDFDVINTGGWTRLCLLSSRDLDQTAPTGDEFMQYRTYDYGSGIPRLVIEYNPTYAGYTSVDGNDVYSAAVGWGWDEAGNHTDRGPQGQGTYDFLYRDHCFDVGDNMTFYADVLNSGTYNVTVWVGDTQNGVDTRIYAEGTEQATVNSDTPYWEMVTFQVDVTDHQLTLLFEDMGVRGDSNPRCNGIRIQYDSSYAATFTLSNDLTFSSIKLTGEYLWLNKSYAFKTVTGFRIHVQGPGDVQFTVDSWFNDASSGTAQLWITGPADANIYFSVYSPQFTSASADNVVSYTYASNTITIVARQSGLTPVVIRGTYGSADANEHTPENYAFEITDMEGCGDIVFTESEHYTFQAQFWEGDGTDDIDTCQLRFNDTVHVFQVAYDHVSEVWSVVSGAEYIRLQGGAATALDANLLQVTYLIYFEDTVLDASDVDVEMWCNDTSGNTPGWETVEANYFAIYSLGGSAEYVLTGSGSRITGGDFFELQVGPGAGTAEANATFRNLQHLHFLFSWWLSDDYVDENETYNDFIEYGLYICHNDVWTNELSVRLDIYDAWLDATHATQPQVYVVMNVSWYHRTNFLKYDLVSVFHEGEGADRDIMRFWVDFWFNKVNASTTIGGRVNSYFVGITNTGTWWESLFGGGAWGPYWTNVTQSMVRVDIEDASGNIISAKQVDLMKISAKVTGSADLSEEMRIVDYDIFSIRTPPVDQAMEGIDTPIFVDTKVPDMPVTGFLAPFLSGIRSAFDELGKILGPYSLSFWQVFVNFLDTVFAAFGWEGGFSWLLEGLDQLLAWVGTSFQAVALILVQVMVVFSSMMSPLGTVLSILGGWIVNTFTVITDTITWLTSSLNHGLTSYGLLGWTDEFGVYHTGLIEGMLLILGIFLPMIELVRMERHGFHIFFQDLNLVMNVVSFIVSLGISVIQLFIRFITAIIESIPVIE